MYGTRRDHQSWIDCATHNPPQWIPCSLVEPVQKVIEPMLDHICGCTVVKPIIYTTFTIQWKNGYVYVAPPDLWFMARFMALLTMDRTRV